MEYTEKVKKPFIMKQTKIVATVGPASESKEVLRKMVTVGANVVRLNFSHGEHTWHKNIINRVRELSEELHMPIGILADMQGPRIRTETKEEIEVKKGTRVYVSDISHKDILANHPPASGEKTILLDMPGIISGVHVGHAILIEDGTVELAVVERGENFLVAVAKNNGIIKNRKGVILPDSHLTLDILSEKDKDDLRFALEEGVDFIGISFVGSVADITSVREAMKMMSPKGVSLPKIVSKIERKEAIKNLAAIVKASDAVMVARGDLGVEMPESEVAILQKHIIAESLRCAKPVIVATQMLKSMTDNPRPTRAEVSDVSNAVIDHADAVMLSEESAAGKYPVEAVAMMTEIIEKTEESPFDDLFQTLDFNFKSETAAMLRSVYHLAESFQAKAILLFSASGHTARLLSHFRPERKLLVATNSRATYNELSVVWGIDSYLFEGNHSFDVSIERLIKETKKEGKLQSGDQAVVFAGRTPDQDTMRLVGIREIR